MAEASYEESDGMCREPRDVKSEEMSEGISEEIEEEMSESEEILVRPRRGFRNEF